MGFFLTSAISKAVNWGKKASSTVGHGLETGAKDVASGTVTAAKAVGGAFKTAGEDVGKVVVTGADDVAHGVTSATDAIAHGASKEFENAVHAGENAYNDVKSDIEKAIRDGEAKIVGAWAKKVVGDLEGEITELKAFWQAMEGPMASEIATIRAAAHAKETSPEADQAMREISQSLAPAIASFLQKSYVSFGLEFGASAELGVGGEVGVGLLAGVPDLLDIRGYGSVGVTAGVDEGAEADVSLVFNTCAPKDAGGASLNVAISLDVAVGGTVVVSYNVPGFTLGGISIGFAGGEEVGVAVGAGYSYVF